MVTRTRLKVTFVCTLPLLYNTLQSGAKTVINCLNFEQLRISSTKLINMITKFINIFSADTS
jgi:hypothetical protein